MSNKLQQGAHGSRAAEERSSETVHTQELKPWARPSSLEAPPPRPGMVQRWIRVSTQGRGDDATNLMRKLREGWSPRKADTAPPDFAVPRIENGRFAGAIGVEGSILMEMPKETNDQRNAHFKAKRERMTAAINQQIAGDSVKYSGRGFGPIEKQEKSIPVREVQSAPDE